MSDKIISVTNSAELTAAINSLNTTGGTIVVEASDVAYDLQLYNRGPENSEITIVSADADNPAVFEKIQLVSSQNITFDNIAMEASETTSQTDITVLASDNIVVKNSSFVSNADGHQAGDGTTTSGDKLAYVRDSDGFEFINNTVSNYSYGISIANATGTVISGSSFTKMTGDGLRLSGVQDTLIENNSFYDFYGSNSTWNHDDMIQIWSASYNTQTTSDLTITGNYFNSGSGETTQTIFIKNEMYDETGEAYENITIENNLIYNGHPHGVTIYDTENVSVTNNTLLYNPGSGYSSDDAYSAPPQINLFNVSGGTVTNNIGNVYQSESEDLEIDENIQPVYLDENSENYIGNNIVNWAPDGVADLRDLALREDSDWAGYGASYDPVEAYGSETPTAVIQQTQLDWAAGIVLYEASQSFDISGYLDLPDSAYTWTFSDGVVMTGQTVTRDFEGPGSYDVTLTISTSDGDIELTRATKLSDPTLLKIDFDSGWIDESSYNSEVTVEGKEYIVDGLFGSSGFYMDGSNEFHIERENDQLQHLNNFTMSMFVNKEVDGQDGALLHMHKATLVTVSDTGAITATVETDEGYFSLTTADGVLGEGEWHGISIAYDGLNGEGLKVYVDGVLVGENASASGQLSSDGSYDLILGHNWDESMQGTVDDFTVQASTLSAEEVEVQYQDYLDAHEEEDPDDSVNDFSDFWDKFKDYFSDDFDFSF